MYKDIYAARHQLREFYKKNNIVEILRNKINEYNRDIIDVEVKNEYDIVITLKDENYDMDILTPDLKELVLYEIEKQTKDLNIEISDSVIDTYTVGRTLTISI